MAISYEASGVSYERLDAFKRACQRAALGTRGALAARGYREPESVRGESAFLIEGDDHYLAHVEEGLGTKNLVADAVQAQTGRCHYRAIGVDTVATIVNDLATCGALPISVAMHAAVGDSEWFADEARARELVDGFAAGCVAAGAVWGGGRRRRFAGSSLRRASSWRGPRSGESPPRRCAWRGTLRTGTPSSSWPPRGCRRTA